MYVLIFNAIYNYVFWYILILMKIYIITVQFLLILKMQTY